MTSFKAMGSSGLFTRAGRVAFHKRSFKEYLHKKKTLENHLYFQHWDATRWIHEDGKQFYSELVQDEPEFCEQLTAYFKQLLDDYPDSPHANKHDPRLPAPPPKKPHKRCTKEDVLRSQDGRKAQQAAHKAHIEANPMPRKVNDNSFVKRTNKQAKTVEPVNQERLDARKELRWKAITDAQELAAQKKQQTLHLFIKSEYARTSNFGNGDPMKQTKRRLMVTHKLSLAQLNEILG